MPRNPRGRRRGARRRLPPRPPSPPGSPAGAPTAGAPAAPPATAAGLRPERLVEREAPYLVAELRRVATVTAVCAGLLAALVAVDRLT